LPEKDDAMETTTHPERAMESRTRLLLGDEAMERMARARVILFGVGGVGSWCAESLVRSGLRHLTIVDSDRVCASNLNRQLMATAATVGQVKVEALRERLRQISPGAEIDARAQAFNAGTADSFALDDYDFVIDAIDSLADKQLLIERACLSRARFYSSMGAALKLDPTRIRVAEFWRVEGCPLARALRQRFKRQKRRPARKFLCVFSDEHLENKGGAPADGDLYPGKVHANGSLMHVTAAFGLVLAGLVVQDLAGGK